MITKRLDEVLSQNIIHLIGADSHKLELPIDLVSTASLFVLSEHEESIENSLVEKVARLNGETFYDALSEIGVNVDGSAITAVQKLIQDEYVNVDEDDNYTPTEKTLLYTGIVNKLFPKMPGKFLVSYLIQTLDEIATRRKEEDDALAQLDQTLSSRGVKLQVKSLDVEEKRFLKNIVSISKKKENGDKQTIFHKRESKREKVLNVLSLRMNKMGDLPSLSYNTKALADIFELDERIISKVADIAITDISIVTNLLKFVNTSPQYKSETAISTVTQALMELGYDDAIGLLKEFRSLSDDNSHALLKDVERSFQFAYLSSLIAGELAMQMDADGIEEVAECAMFYNLGQIIIMYYLPEAYKQIMSIVVRKKMDKHSATREILGMTFDNVGVKLASDWNLPFHIIESMKVTHSKNTGVSKSTMLINLPHYVNDIILSVGQNFRGDGEVRIQNLIDNFNMPRNEFITIFELGWSKLYEYTNAKKIEINRREFLANIVTHFA